MLATGSPGLHAASSHCKQLNLPEKILVSVHLIGSTYHFLFAHYTPDSCSGDGTKKKYLEFCYVAFIIKFFRT